MNPRVIFIGEAPGKQDSGRMPLFGTSAQHAGWRLRRLVGVTRSAWVDVRRVNLFATLPERWDHVVASTTAQAWSHSLLRGHDVIVLGMRVARAFGVHAEPICTWRARGAVRLARIPHTSGRNLVYNDPAMRAHVRAFLRAALRVEKG